MENWIHVLGGNDKNDQIDCLSTELATIEPLEKLISFPFQESHYGAYLDVKLEKIC